MTTTNYLVSAPTSTYTTGATEKSTEQWSKRGPSYLKQIFLSVFYPCAVTSSGKRSQILTLIL